MFIVLEAVGQNRSQLFMNIMRKIIKPSLSAGLMGLVDTFIQMLTRSLVIFMRKIMQHYHFVIHTQGVSLRPFQSNLKKKIDLITL